MKESTPDAFGRISADFQIQGFGDVAEAAETDDFWEWFAEFVDAAVDHDGVELVGKLEWGAVPGVRGHLPVQNHLAFCIFLCDADVDVAAFRQVMNG